MQEEERLRQEVEETNLEEVIFVTDQHLEKIRQEKNKDASLKTLMTLISAGWPNDKLTADPPCLREYWPYRDELPTQNGQGFCGTRIIIPHSMRIEITARAHRSYIGIQYTINTARDIMYWSRMTSDLTEAWQRCETCRQIKPTLPKEPLMTYPVPALPWQNVASDCFECDNQHCLVAVDLYSNYIEMQKLETLATSTLDEQLKQVFAFHGVPVTLITDNVPNYASTVFHQFTEAWDFQHLTSSHYYPKSNGKAESAVKIMKSIITKSNKDGADVWKAILEWRNSPTRSQDGLQFNVSCPEEQDRSCFVKGPCTNLKSSLLFLLKWYTDDKSPGRFMTPVLNLYPLWLLDNLYELKPIPSRHQRMETWIYCRQCSPAQLHSCSQWPQISSKSS